MMMIQSKFGGPVNAFFYANQCIVGYVAYLVNLYYVLN